MGDVSQLSATNVGTRAGRTSMMGDSDRVVAGNGAANLYSQIGYRGTTADAITGTIHVAGSVGGVSVGGSTQSGGFAQIGHGGFGAVAAAINSTITLMGADLAVNGGAGSNAYAQIGHGGSTYGQSVGGDITTLGTLGAVSLLGGAGLAAYSQIGHGGDSSTGVKSGNLSMSAESFVLQGTGDRSGARLVTVAVLAEAVFPERSPLKAPLGDLPDCRERGLGQRGGRHGWSGLFRRSGFLADLSYRRHQCAASKRNRSPVHAMIGNGGDAAVAPGFGGDISVASGGNVSLISGSGASAFTQIGHGGSLSSGAKSGRIGVVSGGDIVVNAPNSVGALAYAQIGHGDDIRIVGGGGSGNRSGDVVVSAASDITCCRASSATRTASRMRRPPAKRGWG